MTDTTGKVGNADCYTYLRSILVQKWTKKLLHACYKTSQIVETLNDNIHKARVPEVRQSEDRTTQTTFEMRLVGGTSHDFTLARSQ